jgi:hypothetical protein
MERASADRRLNSLIRAQFGTPETYTASVSARHAKPLELESPSGWRFNSRGGTRTRDPGIMSSDDPPGTPALPWDDAP